MARCGSCGLESPGPEHRAYEPMLCSDEPTRGYAPDIVRDSGCPPERAAEVEDLMRLQTGGTLDALTRAEFAQIAEVAWLARQVLDREEETR